MTRTASARQLIPNAGEHLWRAHSVADVDTCLSKGGLPDDAVDIEVYGDQLLSKLCCHCSW
jgi:hypothetical protein